MKLKKLCITMLVMITILFSTSTVWAGSVETKIITNKKEFVAKKEEEITINLKLDNFQKIENGLYAYKGQIQYDKNNFYELESKDFETKNDWTSLKYNKKIMNLLL